MSLSSPLKCSEAERQSHWVLELSIFLNSLSHLEEKFKSHMVCLNWHVITTLSCDIQYCIITKTPLLHLIEFDFGQNLLDCFKSQKKKACTANRAKPQLYIQVWEALAVADGRREGKLTKTTLLFTIAALMGMKFLMENWGTIKITRKTQA